MATTGLQIFNDVRCIMDEYTDQGVIIPDADVADLQAKTVLLIDMAQKELYKSGKLYKKFEFTRKPYVNLLGMYNGFDLVEYVGEPQYYLEAGSVAKAYYFEVDGEGTVTIEEKQGGAWQTLTTITVPNTVTSMTAYKGVITPTTTGNLIRLKFAGSYWYQHQNRALFSEPFSASRVPDYRPWVKYTMPVDFRAVDSIVDEYPARQYTEDPMAKWEGYKDLYINYFYEGTVRIVYKPVPTTITAIGDTMEIDDITAKAIVYYVAARLAPFGYADLVNFFESKYIEMKMDSFIRMPQSDQTIIDVYGWSGYNG